MKTTFSTLLFFWMAFQATSQGCSDAGFCTMGAMRPDQHKSKILKLKLNSLEFTQHYAFTRFGDMYLSYIIDVDLPIASKTSFHFKLPYTFIFNQLPTTHGLGDISLSFTRNLLQSQDWNINFTLGGKIPTNGNNLSYKGIPLPSYYQSSLGTYDLVVGMGIIYKNWLFATGYQQAFNRTRNQFLRYVLDGEAHNSFDGTEYFSQANSYANSKELMRSPDVMARLERNFRISRFNAHAGLLAIYRLQDDEATNFKGERFRIVGSKGLTLNGLIGANYRLSANSAIKFLYGKKLTVKDRNPDGLGREYVINIGFERRF
ncbi:hypothetical protein [Raineya sp.]